MKQIRPLSFLVIPAVIVALYISACEKTTETPPNPYDDIDYNTDTTAVQEPDPNTIMGLHKNIFSVRCAIPGCHDGTFEPDFRTVQSSFSTLVYQPVNKFSVNGVDSFEYRVVPFKPLESFIHERLTTPTTDYMPSNGNRLSASDIAHIDQWISNGAKDQNGNTPAKPNSQPSVLGFAATDSSYTIRYDTIKKDGINYNPFLMPQNKNVYMIFLLSDDETPLPQLSYNKLKISTLQDDFSAAASYNATYMNLFGFEFYLVTLNSSTFTPGITYYFRYYVNDGSHPSNLEFPRNEMPFYYKSIFAFYIQ